MSEIKAKKEALLSFDSFDGGGPSYSVSIGDSSVATYNITRHYRNPNHENMCGSGYDVIIAFSGIEPGKTEVKIECRSPIADNYDAVYELEVDENLSVTVTEREHTNIIL